MTDTDATNPNKARETPANGTKPVSHEKRQSGGLEPKDSRNVTGTAKTEDGRWTGAAVRPEEGPKVPETKE